MALHRVGQQRTDWRARLDMPVGMPAGSGPAHVLISAMAGSATNWLDLIPRLSRLGPVIVPDLPGTLAGHTVSPTGL